MPATPEPGPAMTMREIREALGHTTQPQPADLVPLVRPSAYTVSLLPEDDGRNDSYVITVEYRGRRRWAVTRGKRCLSRDGAWHWEPIPSEREDSWLVEHRFDRETALELARQAAQHVVVNGVTAAQVCRAVQGGDR